MDGFNYISDSQKTKRYIDWITPKAKIVGLSKGIPWQAIVVQTALETNWGKSSLLTKYNNFGGIKSVKGEPSVLMDTLEFKNGYYSVKDGFRVWSSPLAGLMGYAEFIHKNKRYRNALKYPNDPYQYIIEIKKAGYATDPNYVAKLHSMLKKYFPS